MPNEIICATIAAKPDMTTVEDATRCNEDLGAFARQRHIDVVIFAAGNGQFVDDKIVEILRTNTRLSSPSIDGQRDQGTLHHLVPAHDTIGRLPQSSLTAAIHARAALRLL